MTLPIPNLDERDYESLRKEALARIPTFTPEWTNFNDSDPGMTLVQLHAWLTETLLYQVNRLPDLAFVNFLNLLGTRPAPARAAEADLTFRFADLDQVGDPLTVLVPKGVQVGVNDPNLERPLTFETDATLRGINAAVAAIIAPNKDDPTKRALVSSYDADAVSLEVTGPFRPFGQANGAEEMLIGLLLRPVRADDQNYFLDRFPEGELDLTIFTPQVFDIDADESTIEGPFGTECLFPWQLSAGDDEVTWQVYRGTDPRIDFEDETSWQRLSVLGDDTVGLQRSGHLYLDMPKNLPAVAFAELPRTTYEAMELLKPPTTNAELAADVGDVFVATDLKLDVWKSQLGLVDPQLQDVNLLKTLIVSSPELDYAAVEERTWVELGYNGSPAPHQLTWLRARLNSAVDRPPQISGFHLNTTRGTAATTRTSEVVGTSAGRPGQTFELKKSPVLIDPKTGEPDLDVELLDPTGTRREEWQRGVDFYDAGRDTPRYLLDPETGTLTFGDGVNGTIPVANSRVIATHYRVGGGAFGNVPAGTITSLKTALPQVNEVTNLREAAGGSDAETLAEAKLRAPQQLRTRDRAVAAEDFADLALRTPGVALRSAFALPLTALDTSVDPPAVATNVPGAVTVVVLPENSEPTPQPSEDQLRLICAHLNERRLITTELYVTGPRYVAINELDVEIQAQPAADLKSVTDACADALARYFHPLTGGDIALGETAASGWPIGGDIYVGNVFDLLLSIAGVDRITNLSIGLDDHPADECLDVLPVAPGTLVHLPTGIVSLNVRYAR